MKARLRRMIFGIGYCFGETVHGWSIGLTRQRQDVSGVGLGFEERVVVASFGEEFTDVLEEMIVQVLRNGVVCGLRFGDEMGGVDARPRPAF